MALLRSLLLIVTLVTQALPVGMIRASVAEKKCTMGCCAALEEAGLGECGCEAAPGVPGTPVPATPPPAQGREIMPQLVWVESPVFLMGSSTHADTDRALRPELAMQTVTTPHVRLTVLFCSFLT
jgi:formylglycine-generating enzyme required for sulfatase activity